MEFSDRTLLERYSIIFIIGLPKAGTTSIYDCLVNQDTVAEPLIKEPNYLSRNLYRFREKALWSIRFKVLNSYDNHTGCVSRQRDYMKILRFGERKVKYYLDGSVSYSISSHALRTIGSVENAKVIYCFRDSKARMNSHVKMLKNLGYISNELTTDEAIRRDSLKDQRQFGSCHMLREFSDAENIKRNLDRLLSDYLFINIYEQSEEEVKEKLSAYLDIKIEGGIPKSNVGLNWNKKSLIYFLFYRLRLRYCFRLLIPAELKKLVKRKFLSN